MTRRQQPDSRTALTGDRRPGAGTPYPLIHEAATVLETTEVIAAIRAFDAANHCSLSWGWVSLSEFCVSTYQEPLTSASDLLPGWAYPCTGRGKSPREAWENFLAEFVACRLHGVKMLLWTGEVPVADAS